MPYSASWASTPCPYPSIPDNLSFDFLLFRFSLPFVFSPGFPCRVIKKESFYTIWLRSGVCRSIHVFRAEFVLTHEKHRHGISPTFVCQVDWPAGNKEPWKWQSGAADVSRLHMINCRVIRAGNTQAPGKGRSICLSLTPAVHNHRFAVVRVPIRWHVQRNKSPGW